MKKNFVYLVAALATTSLAITSCGNDADQPVASVSAPTKINLSASLGSSIKSMTRAENGLQSESMDFTNVGIYVYDEGYLEASDEYTGYANKTVKEFAAGENGQYTLTPNDSLYFPLNQDKSIDVYLYAPYTASPDLDTSDGKMEMTVSVLGDQNSNKDYIASDFLWGKTTAAYNKDGKVNVTLNHAHSKLVFKVLASEGYSLGKVTNISLAGITKKTVVNIADGSCKASTKSSDRGGIVVAEVDDPNDANKVAAFMAKFDKNSQGVACVIPAQTGVSASKITIEMDGKTATASLKDAVFQPGYQYTYTLTVVGTQIHPVCTITPWNDGGTTNIDITNWE